MDWSGLISNEIRLIFRLKLNQDMNYCVIVLMIRNNEFIAITFIRISYPTNILYLYDAQCSEQTTEDPLSSIFLQIIHLFLVHTMHRFTHSFIYPFDSCLFKQNIVVGWLYPSFFTDNTWEIFFSWLLFLQLFNFTWLISESRLILHVNNKQKQSFTSLTSHIT